MRLTTSDFTHDTLPEEIAFIVMGVDTHSTCLYAQTVGFSEDLKHLYGLRYDVLVGDPNDPDVWNQLYDLFNAQYTRLDSRILRPAFIFCDSGGHRANAVYIQSIRNKRLMPIKGLTIANKKAPDPLLGKQTKIKLNAGVKGKVILQLLGVNAAKDELAQMETLTIAGDKRLFYPRGNGFNVDFFKGLLSEKKIGDRWVQPRGGHTDNEPLDTTVYAMACAEYYLTKYFSRGLDKESETMPRKKKIENETANKNSVPTDPTTDSNPSITPPRPTPPISPKDSHTPDTPKPTPSPSQFPHW
jgi:phage terminase large subunit GpA-like protein